MTLCVFPPFYYSYSYENLPARHPRRQVGITIALSTVILAAEEKTPHSVILAGRRGSRVAAQAAVKNRDGCIH